MPPGADNPIATTSPPVSCRAAIRQQTAIGDEQFLKSMILHRSGAILMCQEAPITSAKIKALCKEIIAGQQEEIDRHRAMLGER